VITCQFTVYYEQFISEHQLSHAVDIFHITPKIEVLPAQKIQNFRNKEQKCKILNFTAIASSYADRDPQGETCDGSVL